MPPTPSELTGFYRKTRFICELAKQLHQFGASAPRLEAAIDQIAQRMGLVCNGLSTPTSIILSFSTLNTNAEEHPQHTQVIRLVPGVTHLGCLTLADSIAEQVSQGRLDLDEGHQKLQRLAAVSVRIPLWLTFLAFGTTGASVAILLDGGLAEALAALVTGSFVGYLCEYAGRRRQLSVSAEAIAAFFATLMALSIHHWITPLHVNQVVIASLIVLLPGLMLTTSVIELAHQHLVSGVARFAGAITVLLKLAFGSIAATQLMANLITYHEPVWTNSAPQAWLKWLAVSASALAFAVLFKAEYRDYAVVIASTFLSYFVSQHLGHQLDVGLAVFLGSLAIGTTSNLYGRIAKKPGALVRVPGIILLVPGSLGYRSLSLVFEHNIYMGLDTAFSMLILLTYLVGGLLLGNILIPPRKNL
jgi:uncharacterized membrane protein YjjP (DUF1212 family)